MIVDPSTTLTCSRILRVRVARARVRGLRDVHESY